MFRQVKSLDREIQDLQSEFETERYEYLETIRRQDQQLKLLQQVLAKIHPLLRKDTNYRWISSKTVYSIRLNLTFFTVIWMLLNSKAFGWMNISVGNCLSYASPGWNYLLLVRFKPYWLVFIDINLKTDAIQVWTEHTTTTTKQWTKQEMRVTMPMAIDFYRL